MKSRHTGLNLVSGIGLTVTVLFACGSSGDDAGAAETGGATLGASGGSAGMNVGGRAFAAGGQSNFAGERGFGIGGAATAGFAAFTSTPCTSGTVDGVSCNSATDTTCSPGATGTAGANLCVCSRQSNQWACF